MSSKKILIYGVLIFVSLFFIGGSWHSYQNKKQYRWATRILSAAIQEDQNCLRKLAGWRDHLMAPEKGLFPQLKNCRLKEASVEMTNVPKAACIGLAKGTYHTTSKTIALKTITHDHHSLQEETCTGKNTLVFDFETTEAGLDWYQKMVIAARKREARQYADTPDQATRPHLNLGTVVARLKHLDNESLYDFTVSLEDGSVLIITQDNALSLNDGDPVMIIQEDGTYRIRNKISH